MVGLAILGAILGIVVLFGPFILFLFASDARDLRRPDRSARLAKIGLWSGIGSYGMVLLGLLLEVGGGWAGAAHPFATLGRIWATEPPTLFFLLGPQLIGALGCWWVLRRLELRKSPERGE